MSPNDIIYYLDIIGITGCAIAGTIQAYRHDLDPLGTILIAAIASIGGGTVRDVLLDRHPIFWMTDLTYLSVIICVSIFVQIFFVRFQRINKILRVTDAIGLATFTIIGIEAALNQGANPIIAIFMGVITSSFGGIVRDIICNEVPLVLRKEIYLSASLIGGVSYFALQKLGVSHSMIYLMSGTIAFTVRTLAVYRGWNLPRLFKPNE